MIVTASLTSLKLSILFVSAEFYPTNLHALYAISSEITYFLSNLANASLTLIAASNVLTVVD